MLKRLALFSATALVLLGAPVQAEHGWKNHLFWFDEPEQQDRTYFFDEAGDDDSIIVVPSRRGQASLYGDDLDYYEPQLAPMRIPLSLPKVTKKIAVTKPAKKLQLATAKQDVASSKTQAGFNCDKGVAVVTGYGFSEVKAKSCSGRIFTYGATRASKPFEVSVSANNGEITEVRKVQ